jgi:hypothetical protein
LVAAANSFFGWQKAWQIYTQTQLSLQFALSEWELRTADARPPVMTTAWRCGALQQLSKAVSRRCRRDRAVFRRVTVPDVQSI